MDYLNKKASFISRKAMSTMKLIKQVSVKSLLLE